MKSYTARFTMRDGFSKMMPIEAPTPVFVFPFKVDRKIDDEKSPHFLQNKFKLVGKTEGIYEYFQFEVSETT